jgi:hypothetical protein
LLLDNFPWWWLELLGAEAVLFCLDIFMVRMQGKSFGFGDGDGVLK